jgi:hypothetical protein
MHRPRNPVMVRVIVVMILAAAVFTLAVLSATWSS